MISALFRNVVTALLVAIIGATLLSLIPVVISLVTDTWYFERYKATTWQVVGSYYFAAIMISLPAGLLLPFARYFVVAGLLGAFGGVVLYASVGYTMDGRVRWPIAVPLGIALECR